MGTKYRILIVDDHPDCAHASKLLVTLLGHEARAVLTGTEALAVFDELDPDIVILDIGLPDLSGYDVAREIRRRTPDRHIHLAALTGWGTPADRAQAFAAGFDEHLLKPADANMFRGIIERAEATLAMPPLKLRDHT